MMSDAEIGDKLSPFWLSKTDKYLLSISDAEFEPHTWDELKSIIAENGFDRIRRWPSDLQRYIKWSNDTKAVYGSAQNYILQELLGWRPISSSAHQNELIIQPRNPTPFADSDDYKILLTEWPYGLETGVRHILVWMKNRLELDPTGGDLTSQSRLQVDNFVKRRFIDKVAHLPSGREKVQWGKGFGLVQSVPSIEHFHVFVRDVPEDIILELLNRD